MNPAKVKINDPIVQKFITDICNAYFGCTIDSFFYSKKNQFVVDSIKNGKGISVTKFHKNTCSSLRSIVRTLIGHVNIRFYEPEFIFDSKRFISQHSISPF